MTIRSSLALALALLAPTAPAIAATKVVAVVHTATAEFHGGVLVVNASVDLPNTCWSRPRFAGIPHGAPGPEGQLRLDVVATSIERPGRMCGMVVRPAVAVPALRWTRPPQTLRSLNVTGSSTPVVAQVVWPAPHRPHR
jgi:hypothetical protein